MGVKKPKLLFRANPTSEDEAKEGFRRLPYEYCQLIISGNHTQQKAKVVNGNTSLVLLFDPLYDLKVGGQGPWGQYFCQMALPIDRVLLEVPLHFGILVS